MEESKPKELNLSFRFGDCTNLGGVYKDKSQDVAVDKGTLDAIAVDDTPGTIDKCNAYFNEMVRVLDTDGVLLIVSLLQPHVLKIVVDFFTRKNTSNKGQAENLFTVVVQRIEHIEGYAEK